LDAPISKFEFQRMALMISLRDLFSAPESTLDEVEIRPGFHVLDYGCGSGSFTLAALKRVGPEGKVYALDLHPLALQRVQRAAEKRGFPNIETIQSDCITRLATGTLDVVLFYYTLHWLTDPDCVLGELHRILKPDGVLSFRDPYMKEEEVLAAVTGRNWFRLAAKGEKTYRFFKPAQKEEDPPVSPGEKNLPGSMNGERGRKGDSSPRTDSETEIERPDGQRAL
jgi:ubiquinone/menaquinone biosynthesis C-methylase UbiE